LTQPTAVALSLTKTDGCNGASNGTITATFSGGTGTLQLSLDGGAFTIYTSPKTFTSLAAGSHTVTAKDANACTNTQSITVADPPALSLSLAKTDPLCNGGTGTITATYSGGTGTLQLKLDSGSFTTFTSPHTYSSLATGSHTVTLQDANLCQTSQTVTIVNPPALSLPLTKTDLMCNGGATGTVTPTLTGASCTP